MANPERTAEASAKRRLVEQVQVGDRAAFDALAALVVDRLFAVARLILREDDPADDAVQETLVRCWRDIHTLRDPAKFEPWLYRLLVHAINDEFRSRRRHQSSIKFLRFEPSTPDVSTAVAIREQLDRGFAALSIEHRGVLVLRLYLGLSIEEAAAALGIPVGTAKSRLHYATGAMRGALEADSRLSRGEVTA